MTLRQSADVVVIGSGICGALAAREMALAGASVTMLDAGPVVDRGMITAAFRGSARKSDFISPYPYSALAPHPDYSPIDNGYLIQNGPAPYKAEYLRVVGGTTWHWAAQAWRLLPNDFRIATKYGVGRDWPLSYDDLEPWYYKAEVIAGVSGPVDNGSPRSRPFPMPPVAQSWLERRFQERLAPEFKVITNTAARNSRSYGGRPACCGNNNCMPICPIDAQYHGGLSVASAQAAGVKLVPQAVVYRLEHDAQGKIVAAHFYDWDKVSHRIAADVFILAANAIESPKLLLMSASGRYPAGLANGSGTLGRNLMDHPSNSLTFDADEPLWPGRGPMSPSSIQDLRDGDFRSEHAGFRIDISNSSRVASVTADLIKKGVFGAELDAAVRDKSAREVSIKNVLEQLPSPDNRITLSSQKDGLGLPKPQFYYAFDPYVTRGMAAAKAAYIRIAQRMGGTNLRHSPAGQYGNNQHMTGTLSMGHDPADSVTDAHGRAHDHANLYLVGTGVMPTVATANSTLTAVALALRTADAIKRAA